MKVLTRREAAIVDAIGQTLFPPGGAIPQDSRDAQVVAWVDEFLAASPRQERALMRLMFVLFESSPAVLRPWRPGLFTWLTPERRVAHLDQWEQSRFYARRMAFNALRSVMLMAYAAHPDVEEAIGVAPPSTDPPEPT